MILYYFSTNTNTNNMDDLSHNSSFRNKESSVSKNNM